MKADVNTLTHMFWDCNRKYFGNSLPTPYIALFDKPNIVARFEYITIKVGTPLPDKPPGFFKKNI